MRWPAGSGCPPRPPLFPCSTVPSALSTRSAPPVSYGASAPSVPPAAAVCRARSGAEWARLSFSGRRGGTSVRNSWRIGICHGVRMNPRLCM